MSWKVNLRGVDNPAIGEEALQIGECILGWVDRLSKYLETGDLPPFREEARKVKSRAAKFTVIDRILYRRGFTNPLLRCIAKEEA